MLYLGFGIIMMNIKENKYRVKDLLIMLESFDRHMCRMCLEDDDKCNLIYPCKCKGSSKYVHKNCLNEWRTTSENTHNFKRCELCHHEYKIVNITDNESTCSTDCRKIMRNTFPLYAFFTIISFMLGILLEYTDSEHAIIRNLPNNDKYNCEQCIHPLFNFRVK